MQPLSMLADNPLFAEFSDEELPNIVEGSDVGAYRPGQIVIHVGEPGSFLGVVLAGTVRAQTRDTQGQQVMLGEIPTGGYFGEISLVSGDPTTADVVAVTPCEILEIPHSIMSEALSTHPQGMSHIAKTITARLTQQSHAQAPTRATVVTDARRAPDVAAAARILAVECSDTCLQYKYYDTDNEISNIEGIVQGIGSATAVATSRGVRGRRVSLPAGSVETGEGVICARRHLHLSPEEALMLGLRHKDEMSMRVGGERSLIFNEVAVRVHPEYRLDMHIDTDEANAARLDHSTVGYVESADVPS